MEDTTALSTELAYGDSGCSGCPTCRGYTWALGGPLMPKNLKRYYGRGDLHFVTFSCYRRLPLLRTIRARNMFVRALGAIRERYKFVAGGLCGHARSRAPADQRAAEIDAFGDAEGAQAAGFPRFAQEKTQSRQRAVAAAVHERWFGIAAFLATTLL